MACIEEFAEEGVIVMERKEWRYIDKSKWGDGPWQEECDKVQWEDEETKLPCLAVRNPYIGHWCGYVGVSEGHKFYGVHYGDIESDLDVHGELTYSAYCQEGDKEHGICHIGEDKVYWLGFDCGHYCDYAPGVVRDKEYEFNIQRGEYRTLEYVQEQCKSLCKQLKEV